jgi:hypothetical protein
MDPIKLRTKAGIQSVILGQAALCKEEREAIVHDLRTIREALPEISAALDKAAKWDAVEEALMEWAKVLAECRTGTAYEIVDEEDALLSALPLAHTTR